MAKDELTLTAGPWVGMADTPNLAAQDAARAAYLLNVYNLAASVGGDCMSRPGMTRIPISSTITGTASKAGTTITGSSTLFSTELALGDILEINGTQMLITAIASNTSATASVSGTVSSGAITRFAGGIITGPFFGAWQYQNTDGTTKRFLIARTTSALATRDAASRYGFDDSDATVTALTGTITTFAGGGSTTVVGTGTAFLAEVEVGALITFAGSSVATEVTGGYRDGQTFRVLSISNNTQLDVTTGNTGTGVVATTTASVQVGALRLLEYDPSATPTLRDRTSATMNMVALDTSARLYAITFANYFIISDQTNRMRKITSAFVLSNLTDANYAVLGAPVQYYGKLFLIDASDAITIRWSDENDPDTGFGTGTSTNAWALRQTSADQLTGLCATNDALYCFRQNSVAIITGAANSDFASSGSVDAIQNIGSKSPDSLIAIGGSVFFFDQYGRPGRVQPGYGYVPLWKRIQETLRGAALTAAQLRSAWARYDATTNLLKLGYRTATASTTNAQMLAYDPDSWECLGVHVWYRTAGNAMDHAYSASFLDENAKPRHVVVSGTTTDLAFYVQKLEDTPSASSQDTLLAGAVTVAVTIRTPKLGGDPLEEKTFQRVAIGTRNVGGATTGITLWKVAYRGPYDTAFTSAAAMLLGGGTSVPSSMTLDGAAVKAEFKGLNVKGRWVQFEFTNDTTGTARSTFDTVTVMATEKSDDFAAR